MITRVNNQPVEQSSDLPRLIGDTKPGTTITLQVLRQGQPHDLRVQVGRAPDEEKVAKADAGEKESAKPQGKLGVAVRPLTGEERKQLGTEGGVVVENATGPAAKAGIQPGDVILGVNNQPVKNVDQLRQLVDRAKGNVALLVQRENARVYVPVPLG